ncbi:MAG: hypothetical protein CFK52_13240, partial [Chloracidobacterium sp. CP2_5A]
SRAALIPEWASAALDSTLFFSRLNSSMAKAAAGAKPRQSAKPLPQALYDALARSSAVQWDGLLRNPWLLRPVSLYVNGVLTALERARALMGLGLRMMNVPTREEIAALDRKLTALHDRLDDLTTRLVQPDAPPPKRPARTKTAPKAAEQPASVQASRRKSASPSGRKRAARPPAEVPPESAP